MKRFFAKHVFDGLQWLENVTIDVDDKGMISSVSTDMSEDVRPCDDALILDGYVIPAMPNVHSHAFQRAMAGHAEKITRKGQDSFWTWRQLMYAFVDHLTPEDVESIAAWLYVEMLKSGYGWVGEFHYLHHDTNGKPHANSNAMLQAHISAAKQSGIGLTMIPSLYSHANFGGVQHEHGQRRFINTVDTYGTLLDHALSEQSRTAPQGRLKTAMSFHSLRAVTQPQMEALIPAYPDLNIHMHIAEQEKEVQDSLNWSGKRPAEWLFDTIDVDSKWTLIHATHLNDQERGAIAKSGAIIGFCPTTEANLGDGIFPLQPYIAEGGSFAIGTDSHISIDPVEELRMIEYAQRLTHRRRSLSASDVHRSPALYLYSQALKGGASSMDAPIGAIAVGRFADFVVLDADAPCFDGCAVDDVFDRYVFARQERCVHSVICAGTLMVQNGRHVHEDALRARYKKTLEKIYAQL